MSDARANICSTIYGTTSLTQYDTKSETVCQRVIMTEKPHAFSRAHITPLQKCPTTLMLSDSLLHILLMQCTMLRSLNKERLFYNKTV